MTDYFEQVSGDSMATDCAHKYKSGKYKGELCTKKKTEGNYCTAHKSSQPQKPKKQKSKLASMKKECIKFSLMRDDGKNGEINKPVMKEYRAFKSITKDEEKVILKKVEEKSIARRKEKEQRNIDRQQATNILCHGSVVTLGQKSVVTLRDTKIMMQK